MTRPFLVGAILLLTLTTLSPSARASSGDSFFPPPAGKGHYWIVCSDMPTRNALAELFQQMNAKFTIDRSVTGRVSVSVVGLPGADALRTILGAADQPLCYRLEKGVYHVAAWLRAAHWKPPYWVRTGQRTQPGGITIDNGNFEAGASRVYYPDGAPSRTAASAAPVTRRLLAGTITVVALEPHLTFSVTPSGGIILPGGARKPTTMVRAIPGGAAVFMLFDRTGAATTKQGNKIVMRDRTGSTLTIYTKP